ncbi:uncharacterized protein J4E84_007203 [Alternaria hordeiaustralica]|uniref:uncharacterized protein n=1 Tax=Alternaria hordeiaustralica TaxID=1187925 RepID=UPI0020C3D7BA|nr:uncharacterized protein J4E84_007203 [Alternaria hordeiaustralica]KAI4682739.1 hypothetical protein J4E84_007203 [Alternaria hordeiaustralica]
MGFASSPEAKSFSIEATNMPSAPLLLRLYCKKTRLVIGVILLLVISHVFFGCSIFNLIPSNTSATPNFPNAIPQSIPWAPTRSQSDLRIAKATILYDFRKPDTGTLALDDLHTQNFGYASHILQTPIVRGALNKFLYLQSLIITELQKPIEDQKEWILYHETTVILANPHIPLHHFLPPITDVETFKILSIIATKSESEELNTKVFFIRVSGGSLRILTEAMEMIYNLPDNGDEDEEFSVVATAFQTTLARPHHLEKAIYQPREWYNSTSSLFYQPYYPTAAHRLLSPPVTQTTSVDTEGSSPMFPDADTVHRFWHVVREARRVLNEAKEKGHTSEQGEWWEMVAEVKEWVEGRAWDTEELERRVRVLREGLDID